MPTTGHRTAHLWFCLGALALTMTCGRASANGAPGYPGPIEASVEGPDVHLTQVIPERSHCTLIRVDPATGAETEVGEHGWDEDIPVGPSPSETWQECHAPPIHEQECEETPEDCVDCDGDGVPECVDWCVQWGRFDSVDICAPVPSRGATQEYRYGVGDCILGSQWEPVDVDPVTVVVAQVDDCQLGSANGQGCTCSNNPFPPSIPWLLSLLMVLTGTLSLTVARRHGQ